MGDRTALFGGFPGARYIGSEETQAVKSILHSQTLSRYDGLSTGRSTSSLETALCKLTNRKHSLAVSSGTAALHLAVIASNIKEGDEVVIPAYGWVSVVMAVLAAKAVPVIAPIDDTLNLDLTALADCFTARTKLVIGIHMRGLPLDMRKVTALTVNKGITVIEDCSQSLGGYIGNCPVGSFGDISTFSFQYNKLVTGGEGGALLTDKHRAHSVVRAAHDCGLMRSENSFHEPAAHYIHSFGLNYRISELSSGVILAQLQKVTSILDSLRRVRLLALTALEPEITKYSLTERPVPPGLTPNNAFLCLQARDPITAKAACSELVNSGIPAQYCGETDPHHFSSWTDFLDRKGYRFRCEATAKSSEYLARTIWLELNPRHGGGHD